MQNQLDILYQEYIQTIFSDSEIKDMIENHTLSSPQLLDVKTQWGEDYENADFKVLFVGKETNGWFGEGQRESVGLGLINDQYVKYIKALREIYFIHNIGHKEGDKYSSAIFLFIAALKQNLSKGKTVGILLTELLRHDYNRKGLPNHIINKICYDNNFILRKEIEILKPDALVFLSGPNYDKYIQNTFPMVTSKPLEGYTERQVSILDNIPNIKKAIRIYHPGYFNRLGKNYKVDMKDLITNFLDLGN